MSRHTATTGGKAEARHRPLWGVLERPEGQRSGGHRHPGDRPAEAVLGAGDHRHPAEPEPVYRGAGGRGHFGPAVPGARREDGRQRDRRGRVHLRRRGGHQQKEPGGGLVLQGPERRGQNYPSLRQVRGERAAVCQRERQAIPGAGLLRPRAVSGGAGRDVPGEGHAGGVWICGHL